MEAIFDLAALVKSLREAPANPTTSTDKRLELNRYLVETLMPILRADGLPKFSKLDFDAFEADDLIDLFVYLRNIDYAGYSLAEINQVFCEAAPCCTKTRAFL